MAVPRVRVVKCEGDSISEVHVVHGCSLSAGVLEWRDTKNSSYFEAELIEIDLGAKCPYCIALESHADAFWVEESQLRIVDPNKAEVIQLST